VRVLLWHVHGSWTTSFVHGAHEYLVPVLPDRGPDGRGRARTWDWPPSVAELSPSELRDADPDLVVLQRPHELDLVREWLGRDPGREVPAVYVEHNTPGGSVPFTRHPMADRSDIPIVHVTHFNRLLWDCGTAPTTVVEHGIVDPGYRYSGDLARCAVVVNDPVRRGRAVGADLLPGLADVAPVDVFGMGADALADRLGFPTDRLQAHEDVPQHRLHDELARRRVYVHTARWTSLGLSLLEAMHVGMPVVALATTEAVRAVPPGAGVLTSSVDELYAATRHLVLNPDAARELGRCAREFACQRYGLGRFLADWEVVLDAVASGRR
jgi:hypothetical protein